MAQETQVNTYITREYLEALKKKGLYEKTDSAEISKLTKQALLRGGKGYGAEQIRNFLLRQYTCTVQMIELITKFYEEKEVRMKLNAVRQKNFINQLN